MDMNTLFKRLRSSGRIAAMKADTFKYLFYTWMLAHLIHPLVFGIYCNLVGNGQLFFGWNHLFPVLSFTCLGILISLPALFISFISLRIILVFSLRPLMAMAAWIFAVSVSVHIGGYFMLMSFLGYVDLSFLGILVPGMIAGLAAVLLRYKQFKKLVQAGPHRFIPVSINPFSL